MAIAKQEPQESLLPPGPKSKPANEKARKDALKSITATRRASAWQIHRWPLDKRVLLSRTRVHLPRTYLGRDGEDVRVVREGQDLNQFVHRHYFEELDEARKSEWINFVTPDGVVSRRHEYLGPDPRVAGYHLDVDGEVHIKWWDGFLQDQWMDRQKWRFEVKVDDEGKWAEIDD
ncbi:hypothetical protein IEO21_09921 [Rhodonia placenta]|uniref:Uncharacterized protein n=1 Tax=Rhodonia placenta TaxID=104341 RepID=A0A8H7TXY5_9APHY|nr:hypothetical protein IEO21_09921 [Postia placenta]